MSFHEKSAWVNLLVITGIFVPYFIFVFQQPLAFLGLLTIAVILQVALLVGFHIINALVTKSIRKRGETPPPDEMERLVELRAAKFAGFVLAFVVMSWFIIAAFGAPILGVTALVNFGTSAAGPDSLSIPLLPILTAIHLLFAGFVLSNIAYYGAIIAGFRKLMYGQSRYS
jgi:hypothetical protein